MNARRAGRATNALMAVLVAMCVVGIFLTPSELDQHSDVKRDTLDEQIRVCMHSAGDFDTCHEHLTD